ncbi:MAG TPA: ABC transporter permease [Tepidisphaeraceae bacterium]|jgi:peptide/nickel transport system permease protein|nr:ABC transporter permease [Tepidisphaeraceae bacterium]
MSQTLLQNQSTAAATASEPMEAPEPAAPQRPAMSPRQLLLRRFLRHRLAVAAVGLLTGLYLMAIFADVVAVNPAGRYHIDQAYSPPQTPRWTPSRGLHAPLLVQQIDQQTLRRTYTADPHRVLPLTFFARGEPYSLWGLIPLERRLLGVDRAAWSGPSEPPPLLLLGGDRYGRDVFSRVVAGSRISLSIGLVGVAITFLLGVIIGGISGYVGGTTDTVIQRVIEVFNALPQLPLWLALAAIFPPEWSSVAVFFAITVALSLLNWPALARVVRGKILALREEDYAIAARLLGVSHRRVLFKHLMPGFASHIIVTITLTIPVMILGETSLSFLGLGLRPPVVSWGVMLQDCLDVKAVRYYPWLLSPVAFIVLAVLAFNFFGDGVRDAADPHAEDA